MAVLGALLVGILPMVPTAASEGLEISLQIPGETPVYNDSGQPVLIAGVWHQLTVRLETPVQTSLTLKASLSGSEIQEMNSYYLWERDEVEDGWFDSVYDFFIQPQYSSSDGQEISFRIGMDTAATAGAWKLEIMRDGSSLEERALEVRSPELGYGLSSADFNFRAEPFKAIELSSEDRGQYMRVINQGNVPMRFSVSFDRFQNRLSLVNPSEVAHIYDDTRYFLRLTLDPRPPQIIEVKGVSRVELMHVIPSPGSSLIIPAFESGFTLKIVVGRAGYRVQTVGNVVFQTLESLRADYGSLATWQVYLTGDEEVSFDVEVTNASLVGVAQGENPVTLPATLTPSPQSELPLTLQVRTDMPSTVAEVWFTLRIPETGEVRTFLTTITVGPKPPTSFQPSYLWLFATLLSASVLAMVSYNHWKVVNLGTAALRLKSASSMERRRKGKGPKKGKKEIPERRKGKRGGSKKKRRKGRGKKAKKRDGGK